MKVLCFCQKKADVLGGERRVVPSCFYGSPEQTNQTKAVLMFLVWCATGNFTGWCFCQFFFFSRRQFLCFSKRILTKGRCQGRPLEATVDNGKGKELRQGFRLSAFILKCCIGKGWGKCRDLKRKTNVSLWGNFWSSKHRIHVTAVEADAVFQVCLLCLRTAWKQCWSTSRPVECCSPCSQLARLSVAAATDCIVSSS